jgi:tetratricopeptide (TPR) repeat protein
MRWIALFSLTMLYATSATAADVSALDNPSIGGGDRYTNCLLLIRQNAQNAFALATAWQQSGGGGGAVHCQALALVALHRYSEAAGRLDQLAQETPANAGRAQLYDQAGNAWLLGHRAQEAQASFSSAIQLSPPDADLYSDRARAYAMASNWQAADADLSSALLRSPKRIDLFVLRASARHALGRKQDARSDIDLALTLDPNNADALEYRGELKLEAGDQPGAQSDWNAVIAKAPRSSAAADARQHLDALATPQPAPSAPTPPKPTH